MEPAEPYLPPVETPRSWFRRLGAIMGCWYFAAFLTPAGVYALSRAYDRGFDLVALVEQLAVPVAAAAGIALLMTALMPYLSRYAHAYSCAKVRRSAAHLLPPEEQLLAACPGMFLGPRGPNGAGYLLITDRRLLRLEDTFRGYAWAPVCPRDELEGFFEAQRRSARGPIRGLALRGFGTERALVVRVRDRPEHVLTLAAPALDPFLAWLRQNGFEVEFRNDEDLPEAPPRAPKSLTAVRAPGEWRQSAKLAAALLVFFAIFIGGGIYVVTPRDPAPTLPGLTLPPFVASQPGIPKRQVGFVAAKALPTLQPGRAGLPRGTERLLAEVRVVTAPTRGPGGVTTRGLAVYQVVRIGKQGVLRVRGRVSPGKGGGAPRARRLAWELLGDPSDSDAALIDAAERRLSRPETGSRSGG